MISGSAIQLADDKMLSKENLSVQFTLESWRNFQTILQYLKAKVEQNESLNDTKKYEKLCTMTGLARTTYKDYLKKQYKPNFVKNVPLATITRFCVQLLGFENYPEWEKDIGDNLKSLQSLTTQIPPVKETKQEESQLEPKPRNKFAKNIRIHLEPFDVENLILLFNIIKEKRQIATHIICREIKVDTKIFAEENTKDIAKETFIKIFRYFSKPEVLSLLGRENKDKVSQLKQLLGDGKIEKVSLKRKHKQTAHASEDSNKKSKEGQDNSREPSDESTITNCPASLITHLDINNVKLSVNPSPLFPKTSQVKDDDLDIDVSLGEFKPSDFGLN